MSSKSSAAAGPCVNCIMMATETKNCDFKPRRFDRRPVGDYDVLIDMKYCGICHSDLHAAAGHVEMFMKGGCVPGHAHKDITATPSDPPSRAACEPCHSTMSAKMKFTVPVPVYCRLALRGWSRAGRCRPGGRIQGHQGQAGRPRR